MEAPGRPLAVLDIDGVLADVTHRLWHLSEVPKAWEAFFAAASDDPLLQPGYRLAHELAADHVMHYLTGRPERSRALTRGWLVEHALPGGRLIMRPDGDHRPARVFKREVLEQLAGAFRLAVVVDDDPQVVELLASVGLPARLADWLPYAAVLSVAQEDEGQT